MLLIPSLCHPSPHTPPTPGSGSLGGSWGAAPTPEMRRLLSFQLFRVEVATWKDLMKVHSKVRMPSPRLSSLTRRMTRKRRKKVMEMREFSSAFWNPLAIGGGS